MTSMNDMKNKFNILDFEILKNTKLGLEFEFFSEYDYVKTLEILNNYFNPIQIYGFNEYHSDFQVTNTEWKIEPDYSGGSEMIELITGPLEYHEAKLVISKVCEFISKHGHTNDNSSIHINISFEDIDVTDLNTVKFILNLSEDYIYSKFPNRINNIYARSIKYIIPFEKYTYIDYGLNNIINTFKIPEEGKYYGVNFNKIKDNYLEFRYIGGKDYESKKIEIFELLNYFIMQMRNAILEDYNQDDYIRLAAYLEDNIRWYRKYATYDEFLMNIEGIDIEVDKSTKYEDIKDKWHEFKEKVFHLIKYSNELKNCTINYNTFTKRIEVIDTNIDSIQMIKNVDFVNCIISNSNFYNCDIIECDITNSHIYSSNIYDSKIHDSKLSNTKATEYTELNDVVFDGGIIDCIFNSGIYRSGQVSYNADISSEVIMANVSNFWMITNVGSKKKDFKK